MDFECVCMVEIAHSTSYGAKGVGQCEHMINKHGTVAVETRVSAGRHERSSKSSAERVVHKLRLFHHFPEARRQLEFVGVWRK